MEKETRLLIAMTAIAMNMPSAYTISWAKEEHPDKKKFLYAGLAITAFTLIGAFANLEPVLWLGLAASLGFFAFVIIWG